MEHPGQVTLSRLPKSATGYAVEDIRVPADMIPAMRYNLSGKTGAVSIYRRVIAANRDRVVSDFAPHHLTTEQRHLRLIPPIHPAPEHNRLLPVWRAAGWLTGVLHAAFGPVDMFDPVAVFRTVDAVESFVDGHYAEQLNQLLHRSKYLTQYRLLDSCRAEELMHRDYARARLSAPGRAGRICTSLVTTGSRPGVFLARRC